MPPSCVWPAVVLTLRAQGDLVSRREIVKIRGMYRHRHRGRGLAVLALGLVILGLGHMRLVRVAHTRVASAKGHSRVLGAQLADCWGLRAKTRSSVRMM